MIAFINDACQQQGNLPPTKDSFFLSTPKRRNTLCHLASTTCWCFSEIGERRLQTTPALLNCELSPCQSTSTINYVPNLPRANRICSATGCPMCVFGQLTYTGRPEQEPTTPAPPHTLKHTDTLGVNGPNSSVLPPPDSMLGTRLTCTLPDRDDSHMETVRYQLRGGEGGLHREQ